MISVVFPAYNEEEALYESVMTAIQAADITDTLLDIIIVNDGSIDGTASVVRRLEKECAYVRSIHHFTNMGIGRGVIDALAIAKYDRITVFPADNCATLQLMVNLFKNSCKADIVISYTLNNECRSWIRNLLSSLYSLIYTSTFETYVKYINGSAIYPVAALRRLSLHSQRFSIIAEINVKLLRQGLTYYEVEGVVGSNVTGSSAFRLKNLVEVICAYVRLIYEIYWRFRSQYRHHPTRVLPI